MKEQNKNGLSVREICIFAMLGAMMYAPAQAILFGLDLDGMIAWIIAGLPMDVIHAVSNFAFGFLVLPLSKLLIRLSTQR